MSLWWQGTGRRACARCGVKCEEGEEEQGDWGFCGLCKGEENESRRKGFEKRRESLVGGRKSVDRSSTRRLSLMGEREKGQRKVWESDSSRSNGGGRSSEGEIKGVRCGGFLKIGKVLETTALTRNKAQLFHTTRRLEKRLIPPEEVVSQAVIDEWFASTALRVGIQLSLEEKRSARRLLYTWRDVFETHLLRIRQTDLIEHAIVLTPNAKPY